MVKEIDQSSAMQHLSDLRESAKKFPRHPGVYLMRDAIREVIYVGKARDLKARVGTYFAGGDGRQQIEFLLRRVRTLESIITESEEEALILERDLINKYKPRYNVRLKDDKSYISVRLDKNQDWPRLEIVRKVQQDGALYFGPYTDSGKIRSLLEVIKKVLPLRTCNNTVFYNRQRPCLEYQIKRCSGPCCLAVDRKEYMGWIEAAIRLLQGKCDHLLDSLNERMESASANLNFEEAAILRDRIEALQRYSEGERPSLHHAESRDCFAYYRDGANLVLCVLMVRYGRIADSSFYSFQEIYISDEEFLEEAILQYYQGEKEIPSEIVIQSELSDQTLIARELKRRRGASLEIILPKRGSKQSLVALAKFNAERSYQEKFNFEERYELVAKELALRFNLRQIPRRIECVDISNLQGSDIVGASICFFDGRPDKERYRKYKISFQDKPDDFAAIKEVVYRRLKRGRDEDDLPDLLLIDGGAKQLAKAIDARDEIGVSVDIISIAKIRSENSKDSSTENKTVPERIFLQDCEEPILLDMHDPTTHFLQRIRDEVHRFVITFHRSKRAGRVLHSTIDQISGVGPERRRRLLAHFGSIDKISKADPKVIARIGRMPLSLAEKISSKLAK